MKLVYVRSMWQMHVREGRTCSRSLSRVFPRHGRQVHRDIGPPPTGEAPWIDNSFSKGWMKAKANGFHSARADACTAIWANPPSVQARTLSGDQVVGQELFMEPTQLWKEGNSKLHRKSPGFRCKRTKERLWIRRQRPDWVKQAFHTSEFEGNEFSWTALISQHTKCKQGRQALEVYQRMLEHGVKPSSYTFVAVLKACGDLRDLETCKRIHGHVRASGLDSDVFLGTMLVDVYSKCGSLVHARGVFDGMPCRNVASWNAMILGYTQMQEGELGWELYRKMQQEGFVPDGRTLVAALKACSTLVNLKESTEGAMKGMQERCLQRARAIHVDVVNRGLETDVFVGTMLTDVYAKCGCLEDARRVFDKMPHHDAVSWNAMILGYAQMEDGEVALQMYAKMQQEGVVPTHRTFVAALKACSSLATLEGGREGTGSPDRAWCLEQVRVIHSDFVKSGSGSDVFVGTMLVDVYAKWGQLTDARSVFDKMPRRNVVSWTAMILGYAYAGDGDEALQLFGQMEQEGVELDDRTLVAALKACSSLVSTEVDKKDDRKCLKSQCLDKVRAIHLAAIEKAFDLDMFVGNLLVDVYAKCGSLTDARHVFEKMRHRNLVAWNAMIFGYAQMEHGDVALQLYERMQHEGPAPDDLTFIAALKACGSVAALEKGDDIKTRILARGPKAMGIYVATALIDMYGKCGSMGSARELFDALPTRNIATWNALIAGYAHQGDSRMVFYLYQLMRQDGIQPDGITFLGVLTLCSHVGLVDKGQKYFIVMSTDFDISPTIEHYSCMVDLLARAGKLNKAMEMVATMPFQPSGNMWRSVLGACQKWRNVELGRQAFKGAVKLDENDAASYVLMSNIYASAHMQADAEEIQAMRAKLCSWKRPGYSWWTDTGGIAHGFVVGDRENPKGPDIYKKLQCLSSKLREEVQNLALMLPVTLNNKVDPPSGTW